MNRELLQQALDALMGCAAGSQKTLEMKMEAAAALRAALAEPAPEPVAYLHICKKPGRQEVFATVDPDDNSWWPEDQWLVHEVHKLYAAPAPVVPEGDIVVSYDDQGQIVCVTQQDKDGQFLSVIAESAAAPPAAVPESEQPGFKAGARAMFDALHMRIANNWHPAHMLDCDRQNAWASAWLQDALQEISADDAAEWRSIQEAYELGAKSAAAPPAAVPLTDEQIMDAVHDAGLDWHRGWTAGDAPNRYSELVRAVEKAVLAKMGTTPPVPLTDEQIHELWHSHRVPVFGMHGINPIVFARAVEQAHGISERPGGSDE